MRWLLHTVLLASLLGSTCGLCAFDLQYGSLFNVKGITLNNGLPVLPTSRGKYANVRVLDKGTFELLRTCGSGCKQLPAQGEVQISHIRPAKTRPDMWIADVSVDEKWLLTFLVFKKGGKVSFISPEGVEILDAPWLSRVHNVLQTYMQAGGEEK